jgi:two-component system, HptB-dependent secretion and biofilm response regulator
MKLLIAEDSLSLRMMLKVVVNQWGFDPVLAEDGQEAWEILNGVSPPRLVLLDWEMPKMDGLEVCQRVRAIEAEDPPYILLLTARSDTADIVSGLEAGANDYIAKPFENAELQARLQVGKRVLDLQNKLNQARNILTSEREVIENIILKMRASGQFDPSNLRQLEASVENTSGDILLSAFRPDKGQHIMLGDFTGHGLTAAIGGPVVSDIFYSMTQKGLPMHLIINEINRHLCEKMPTGLFLASIFVELDPERRQLLVWNCGMQAVLIFRSHSLLQRVASDNLALGIHNLPIDPVTAIEIEAGDHIYAYSDGITEVFNSQGEEFGVPRLEIAIGELLTSNGEIGSLMDPVQQFCDDAEQLDDITLMELTC